MLRVFTGGPVVLREAKKGEAFQLLGGNIQGEFEVAEPFCRVVQKWRLKSWPEGHYSRVDFSVMQGKEDTLLRLTQTGVPKKELDATRAGWARYYFEAIRRAFGFGSAGLV
jgi:activator of HSP90 ATPase